MSTPRITRTPLASPALSAALNQHHKDHPLPVGFSCVPKTRAEFERMAKIADAELMPTPVGRRRKGQRKAPTRTRSIRAPASLWLRIEEIAKARGISANQAAVIAMEHLVAE